MIGDLDEAVGRLAAAQHGVFARRQARELGATGEAIDWRVTCGRWEALPDGVLRMPGAPVTARQAVMAATLAFVHLSARELYGRTGAIGAVLTLLGCLGLLAHAHEVLAEISMLAGQALAWYGIA